MHSAALYTLRTACRPAVGYANRTVGASIYLLSYRKFHLSTTYCGKLKNGARAAFDELFNAAFSDAGGVRIKREAISKEEESAKGTESTSDEVPSEGLSEASESGVGDYESVQRLEYNPPIWFLENNVKCIGDPRLSGSLGVHGYASLDSDNKNIKNRISAECGLQGTKVAKYSIHMGVYEEILSTLRAGLALRPPINIGATSICRPITVLQCPKGGSAYYLDAIVEDIAGKLDADLVRLDAEDVAQIFGPSKKENLAWTRSSTSLLGYEVQGIVGRLESYDIKSGAPGEVEMCEEDAHGRFFSSAKKRRRNAIWAGHLQHQNVVNWPNYYLPNLHPTPVLQRFVGSQECLDDITTEVLDHLVNSAEIKRAAVSMLQQNKSKDDDPQITKGVIIQVQDYKELLSTSDGENFISNLRQIVDQGWLLGRNIMCVGTTSSERNPAQTISEITRAQFDIVGGEKRTILVPPGRRKENRHNLSSR